MSSRAIIAGGSVVSFVDSIADQDQSDILNSIGYAQLMADRYCDRVKQLADWFEVFTNVLMDVGWEVDEEIMDADVVVQGAYDSLEEAALLNLQGLKQASLKKGIRESIEALRLDSIAQQIFEGHSRSGNIAYYQFVPCEPRKELGNYIYVSGLRVTSRRNVKNILFNGRVLRETDVLDTQLIWAGFYLKREHYDSHRANTVKELASVRENFFRKLKH